MRKTLLAVSCLLGLIIIALGLGVLIPRPLSSALATDGGPVPADSDVRTVFVLSSPIHTDIAFPADPDVIRHFAFMAGDGLDPAWPGVGHVIAGWGGRSFYIETPTWADLKPGPLFKALTVDGSVMHMSLAGSIDPTHPQVHALSLDRSAFERLLDAVSESFARDADGAPVVIAGVRYGPNDLFYEADGWFNALAGCNVWTGRMLREAGITTGLWTPLPGLLTASLALHNEPGEALDYVPGDR
ncbi:MAG: TIGR02117 family protein [Hoeflea sp.]|uniref:TIGR02117 family protein n=1 Tax=Hoeflea sp. TaxID=1940281 RepID=UPI0032EF8020